VGVGLEWNVGTETRPAGFNIIAAARKHACPGKLVAPYDRQSNPGQLIINFVLTRRAGSSFDSELVCHPHDE